MPVITALLATNLSQTVQRQAWPGVVQDFAYSPFGSKPSGGPADARLGFNGQRFEPATRGYLLGNGHRLYNPALMRFTRPDALSPFGKGGVNGYAYCEGDPVSRIDPTGEWGEWFARIAAPLRPSGNTAVTALNIVAGVKAPPQGQALWGLRAAIGGGVTTTVGGLVTAAGVFSGAPGLVATGASIATVGGVVTGVGATLRIGPAVKQWWALPDRWQVAKTNAKQLFWRADPQPPDRSQELRGVEVVRNSIRDRDRDHIEQLGRPKIKRSTRRVSI